MLRATCSPFAAALPASGNAATYLNGSNHTTFDVTLMMVANRVISAAPLDFGQPQGLLTSDVSVNTNLSDACARTTPHNVGLNAAQTITTTAHDGPPYLPAVDAVAGPRGHGTGTGVVEQGYFI